MGKEENIQTFQQVTLEKVVRILILNSCGLLYIKKCMCECVQKNAVSDLSHSLKFGSSIKSSDSNSTRLVTCKRQRFVMFVWGHQDYNMLKEMGGR